ncbi:NADPH:quinone reductase-like Zn-dependent oxidoreductase [Oxalobacteraceae bacterium GrIS 1.11]
MTMSNHVERIAGLSPEKRALLVKALAGARQQGGASEQFVPRAGEHFSCMLGRPGNFDGIRFKRAEPTPPGPGQIQIGVRAVSLNFRDLMMAMDMYPPTPGVASVMGSDYAGEVLAVGQGVADFAPGDRVMALSAGNFGPDGRVVEGSHFCSTQTLSALQVVPMPQQLSFEAAAGVPTVFLTSYYALRHVARVQPGERVLIHSATGGVGLASLQIATWLGAEIFASAGSDAKRRLLEGMGIAAPMDSRTLEFGAQIMQRTQGKGVDVILNTLPGAAIATGLACLGVFGRFLQVEKQDISRDQALHLLPFQKGLSFSAIDLALFIQQPDKLKRIFLEIAEHLRQGHFAPVQTTTYPFAQLGEALTTMSRAKHVGKLVLRYA